MVSASRGLRRGGSVALSCLMMFGTLVGVEMATTASASATVPTGGFTVDVNNREDVRQFYNTVHASSDGITDGWSGGSIATCTPGTVSPDFLAATLARTNYFRAMAGEPQVTYNGTNAGTSADPNNAEAQAAAMMQAANNRLNHQWQPSDTCATQLPLGVTGAMHVNEAATSAANIDSSRIDSLVYDGGALGHRRNMFDPRIATMGAGAVPASAAPGNNSQFAHLVLTTPLPTRPAVRDNFVAWPPKGFVPYQVVPARWSFSLANANFATATVTVQHNGAPLAATIQCFNPDPTNTSANCDASPSNPGTPQYGEPAILFTLNVPDGSDWPQPAADDPYTVTVGHVVVNGGAPQDFTYTTTVIDPAMWDKQWTAPTGPLSPRVGQNNNYSFTTVPGATGYQWRTTQLTPSTFSDGAEAGLGNWTADVSAYAPIQTAIKATGTSAFHLSLRSFAHSETLTLNRTLLAAANSQLTFNSRVVNFDHLVARVQVSKDGGTTWDSPPVFEQTGGNEGTFTNKVVSLGAYAGKQINVRFWFDYNFDFGTVCLCDTSSWYFDDVALSNIQETGTPVLSAIGANPSFVFNPSVRSVFKIEMRPQLAGPSFGGFSQPLTVTSTVAATLGDFNGNGSTDIGIFRPSVGGWYVNGQTTVFLGLPGDVPAPGDYNGDGTTDRAVFRPSGGGWYIDGQATVFFGLPGDIPVPGDYNGDGTTDIAVYRPSVGGWYIRNQTTVFFGLSSDTPVPGDYNGDGTTDVAVYRPAVGGWYINGQTTVFHGINTDTPVPGDYNGDGTTDIAVYRAGQWLIRNQTTVFFGLPTDTPVQGDYNGDHTTDIAVFRSSVGGWFINGQTTVFFGLPGDIPTPKRPGA